MACWVDADEGGQAVDWNGCGDAVVLGVDHGDGAGLGVDDVDLVANRVYGQICRVDADLQGAVLAEVDEIEHRDGVGAAVADVSELAVSGRHVGEAAPTAPRN